MSLILSPELSIVIGNTGKKVNLYHRKERKRIFLNSDSFRLVYLVHKGKSLHELANSIRQSNGDQAAFNFLQSAEPVINDLKKYKFLVDGNSNPSSVLIRKETLNPALRNIQLEITRVCNLRCQHCYLEDYSAQGELRTEEVFKLIDEASSIGVQEFDITGGEPTVRRDLRDVLSYIYKKGMYTKLYTNGTTMDDDFIDFLKNLGIEAVKISLDGYTPKTHDEFRRAKGGFIKTIDNIKKLRNAGIPVEVGSVVTKVNLPEAQQLIDFLKNDLKVKYHIDSFIPIGQGIDTYSSIAITDEEYISVLKDDFKESLQHGSDEPNSQEVPFFCGAGNSYVFITCRGLVKFCPTMTDELSGGNLRENTLSDIWTHGGVFEENRNINCKFIDSCPHARECKGGCRSRSIMRYGNIIEPDLQMCKMFYEVTGIKSPGLIEYENSEIKQLNSI